MFDHQKTTKPKIEIQLPANIRTPEVEKLWGDWLAHLKQKHTPPTKKAIEMQMKKLSDLGPRPCGGHVNPQHHPKLPGSL
jgi:hypothetical protein